MDDIPGLVELNAQLERDGMPSILIVDPATCRPQALNARYMSQETMERLVENIKKDKRLESVPLVHIGDDGVLEIISGHHRVEAAQRAGLEKILVIGIRTGSRDELVARLESLGNHTGLQVRVVHKADENTFRDLMTRVKHLENIKSNAVAFSRLLDLAAEKLKDA